MKRALFLLFGIFTLVHGNGAGVARAQTSPYTWQMTTDGSNANWNVSTNWLDGTASNFVPVSGATTQLIFDATGIASYIANNDLGAFTFGTITFNNTGTGTIALTGNDLVLGTTPTFSVTGAASIANIITGTGPLALTGTGTLTLSGANTFTGGVTMSSGTLVLAGSTISTASSNGFPLPTAVGPPAVSLISSPIGTGTLTMNGGTLSISGGNRAIANPITYTGTSSSINVPTGLELTTTGVLTSIAGANITKIGNGLWRIADAGSTSVGTLGNITINDGIVQLTDVSPPAIGGDLATPSITVNTGGAFVFGSNPPYPLENPDLPANTVITLNAGGTATFNVIEDFGAVSLQGGNLQIRTSPFGIDAATAWSVGTITSLGGGVPGFNVIDGGAAITKTSAGTVTVTDVDLLTTGAMAIQAGTLSTNRYIANGGTMTLGTSSTTGTFRFAPTGGNLAMVLSKTLALSSGASGGGVIDVANASAYLIFTGTFSGTTRPFTKTGPGTMVYQSLTGAQYGYSSTISINQGTFRASTTATPVVSSFNVSATGTLSIDNGAGTTSFGGAAVTLSGTGAIQFDLNAPAPTVPLMNITGALTRSGTPVLRLTNQVAMTPGIYTLIDYTGTAITSGLIFEGGRNIGNLIYDSAGTRIQVDITGSDTTKWTGALGTTWDVGTTPGTGGTNNWQTIGGGAATNFLRGDSILLNDEAAPNYTLDIPAATTVRPSLITVNAIGNYTIQGAGSISGTNPLVKSGSGTLTILNDNDFGGTTTINEGVLQVGNGGTTGSIGSINLVMGTATTFGFNRTLPMTIAGLVSTTGSVTIDVGGEGDLVFANTMIVQGVLIKTGPGKLLLGGDSDAVGTFNGALTINGGTVQLDDLGRNGDLGASLITINSGGKFILGPHGNPDMPGTTGITINAGGEYIPMIGEVYGTTTLAGGTLRILGTPTGSVTDQAALYILESGSIISETPSTANNALGISTATTNYNKITAGTVTVTGRMLWADLPIAINEGTIAFEGQNTPVSGNTNLSIGSALTAGRVRLTDAATVTMPRPVVLGDGGAEVDIQNVAATMTFSGIVSGASLTKAGPGTLTLGNANTYLGTTNVNGGRLNLNGVNTAATGQITVAGGATLGGNGSTTAPIVVEAGGTIRGGTSIGTLGITRLRLWPVPTWALKSPTAPRLPPARPAAALSAPCPIPPATAI